MKAAPDRRPVSRTPALCSRPRSVSPAKGLEPALHAVARALTRIRTAAIAVHERPDGDAIGSALALASLLRRRGMRVTLLSKDPLPDYCGVLPGVKSFRPGFTLDRRVDCALYMECSSPERAGAVIPAGMAAVSISIDHHAGSSPHGDLNYIDAHASSNAELIYRLFAVMNAEPNRAEAVCLYTGVLTDTGCFQFSNTTPDCLRMAARLVEAGVSPAVMNDLMYAQASPGSLRLMGIALGSMRLYRNDTIAVMRLSCADFHAAGAGDQDTEGIVNRPLTAAGIQVSALVRPGDKPHSFRISVRSRGTVDVGAVARACGGGGHRNAAGFSLSGTPLAVERSIVAALSRAVGT